MAYKVSISKEAQIELGIAECYYRQRGIEEGFLEDFSYQLQFLKTTPESFQVKYRNIRTIQFQTFNYFIHCDVEANKVMILRMLNQRQHY
jgi:hypothetical protein